MTTAKENIITILVIIIIIGFINFSIAGIKIQKAHKNNENLQSLTYKRTMSAMKTAQEIKQYCNKKEIL